MTSLRERAQLALDTILRKPTRGVPSWMLHVMQHSYIERIAGSEPGAYERDPEGTYLEFQRAAGTCLLDQYIPRNPLTMAESGFDGAAHGATTGATSIVLDGIVIDSPEAVAHHLECVAFPHIQAQIRAFDLDQCVREILDREREIQQLLGPSILKSGYGFVDFPRLVYGAYGYTHYFAAYACYPDLIEKHFSLQADLALLHNRAAARAYQEGALPPMYRLDHDMAGSRGLLVDVQTLDRLWFPHFARCLEPMLNTEVSMIWHCDGNLMQMVPRLLEVGIRGFQGFQYEDGMDYERICAMKTRYGKDLVIVAGVSVTRTLPFGTPQNVKRELAWLVDNGPSTGLFLGGSSSIAPGVPWENIETLIQGLQYYQLHGR